MIFVFDRDEGYRGGAYAAKNKIEAKGYDKDIFKLNVKCPSHYLFFVRYFINKTSIAIALTRNWIHETFDFARDHFPNVRFSIPNTNISLK